MQGFGGRPNGRPPGEVREALAIAARDLALEQGGATWRELARHAGVGYAAARQTAYNMLRAGALAVLERRRVQGSRRPVLVLVPTTLDGGSMPPHAELADALNTWRGASYVAD
jgi:hypothetical protein